MSEPAAARRVSAAASDGLQLTAPGAALSLATASDLQMWLAMANQAQLETASIKQNRNLRTAADKDLKKRPPVKKLPPPDEDVLYFLPIG